MATNFPHVRFLKKILSYLTPDQIKTIILKSDETPDREILASGKLKDILIEICEYIGASRIYTRPEICEETRQAIKAEWAALRQPPKLKTFELAVGERGLSSALKSLSDGVIDKLYRELNIYVDATNVDKRHMVAAELALDGLYRAIAVVPVAELAPMVSHVLRYRAHDHPKHVDWTRIDAFNNHNETTDTRLLYARVIVEYILEQIDPSRPPTAKSMLINFLDKAPVVPDPVPLDVPTEAVDLRGATAKEVGAILAREAKLHQDARARAKVIDTQHTVESAQMEINHSFVDGSTAGLNNDEMNTQIEDDIAPSDVTSEVSESADESVSSSRPTPRKAYRQIEVKNISKDYLATFSMHVLQRFAKRNNIKSARNKREIIGNILEWHSHNTHTVAC